MAWKWADASLIRRLVPIDLDLFRWQRMAEPRKGKDETPRHVGLEPFQFASGAELPRAHNPVQAFYTA